MGRSLGQRAMNSSRSRTKVRPWRIWLRVRVLVKSGQAESPVVYGFYADNVLSPGDIFVIAKNARQFEEQFGFRPSFEARFSGTGYEDTENVRNLLHERDTSRRTWALANTGAVVALIGDHGTVIDAVAYGHDPGGYLGLQGDFPSASGGQSLLRVSTVGVSGRMPSALRADSPSPGIVPPSPTPTLPTPTPIPLPLPTPITPTPSPTPTPTPTPIPPLPTPTPLPTSTLRQHRRLFLPHHHRRPRQRPFLPLQLQQSCSA